MTAATVKAIANRDQYEILRRYAAGADIADVVAETKLGHDYVAGIVSNVAQFNRNFARTLTEDYERTRRPTDLAAVKTTPASPAPPRVDVPAVRRDAPARPEPVGALLDRAAASGDAKLVRLAERARSTLADIQARLDATEAERETAERVAKLAAELERARAELRAIKGKPLTGTGGKVRRWAIANGLKCPSHGRIPTAVLEAYKAAQRGGQG